MQKIKELLNYFPSNIHSLLENAINQNEKIEKELQEIRIRVRKTYFFKIAKARYCN